jgi:Protein of unknown function (DUF3563)
VQCSNSAQAHKFAKESDMKYVTNFFSYLAQSDLRSKQALEEAYLAKSANIYDLESRMRNLEQQRNYLPWGGFNQQ